MSKFAKVKIVGAVVVSSVVIAAIVVWLWPKHPEVLVPKVDVVARIKYPAGSLECVDLFYGAVRNGDHRQYQVCLANPLPNSEFQRQIAKRRHQMKKAGYIWDIAPVKKGVPGIKGAADKVWATSPWTGKEEVFHVIKSGQYWKIEEER